MPPPASGPQSRATIAGGGSSQARDVVQVQDVRSRIVEAELPIPPRARRPACGEPAAPLDRAGGSAPPSCESPGRVVPARRPCQAKATRARQREPPTSPPTDQVASRQESLRARQHVYLS